MSSLVVPKCFAKPLRWKDEVYNTTYALWVGPWDRCIKWARSDKYPEDLELGSAACTFWSEEGRSVTLWLGDEPMSHAQWDSIVAHEALHAAWGVLDSSGVRFTKESTEAFTYYLGWIVKQISSRIEYRKAKGNE